MLGRFLFEHSLSMALAVGFVLTSYVSWWVEKGTWAYDFWMMIAGCFGGSLILVLLARVLWERGSDPATPPGQDKE